MRYTSSTTDNLPRYSAPSGRCCEPYTVSKEHAYGPWMKPDPWCRRASPLVRRCCQLLRLESLAPAASNMSLFDDGRRLSHHASSQNRSWTSRLVNLVQNSRIGLWPPKTVRPASAQSLYSRQHRNPFAIHTCAARISIDRCSIGIPDQFYAGFVGKRKLGFLQDIDEIHWGTNVLRRR